MFKFPSNQNLEPVLEIQVLAIKSALLIFVVLQRKYSPGVFGWDNFQDQTDAAVEDISLFNRARGADLVTAQPCSLKTAAAELDQGILGSEHTARPGSPQDVPHLLF